MAEFPFEPRLARVGQSERCQWPSFPGSSGPLRLAKVKEVHGRVPPRAQACKGRPMLSESMAEFPPRVQAHQGWPKEKKFMAEFPLEPRLARVCQSEGSIWLSSPSSPGSPRLANVKKVHGRVPPRS